MIHLEHVSKIFGKADHQTIALDDINLTIEKGEFVSIMGSSGSGKSTLLNILGCMDRPTSGNYEFNQLNTTELSDYQKSKLRNESISFVFQHFALLHNYSVFDNVALPLLKRGLKHKTLKEKVHHYLSELKMEHLINKNVSLLSGGQKQRVAIARALSAETELILADEPTGALDRKNSTELMELLTSINQSGKTIVLITHDEQIAHYSNRKLTLVDGKLVD